MYLLKTDDITSGWTKTELSRPSDLHDQAWDEYELINRPWDYTTIRLSKFVCSIEDNCWKLTSLRHASRLPNTW